MVGLDVTHRAMLSAARAEALRETGRAGAVVADLHAFYRRFHAEVYGHDDTPVHDALAVANVIQPDLLTTEYLAAESTSRWAPAGAGPSSTACAGPAASRTPTSRWTSTPRGSSICCAGGSARFRDRLPLRAPAGRDPAAQRPDRVPRLGPEPGEVRLRVGGADHPLEDAGYGIYEATVDAGAGDDYEFVLDGTRAARPVLALAAGGPARPVAGRRSGGL